METPVKSRELRSNVGDSMPILGIPFRGGQPSFSPENYFVL